MQGGDSKDKLTRWSNSKNEYGPKIDGKPQPQPNRGLLTKKSEIMLDSTLNTTVWKFLTSIPVQKITNEALLKMSLEDTLRFLKDVQRECESFGIPLKSPKHTELLDLIVLLELVLRYYY